MNIGLITPYFPDRNTQNSGIANHYHLLSESLKNLGHSVVIIHIRPIYENEDAVNEKLNKDKVILLTYKVALPNWFKKFFKHKWAFIEFMTKLKCMYTTYRILNKVIKKYNIEVIEATSYFSLCYFVKYSRVGIPIAYRVSTTFSQMMSSYYGFESRLFNLIGDFEINLIKKSNHLITHASNHALELKQLYEIDERKFNIIPHGIRLPPLEELNNEARKPLKVLYVGRLEYRKGTDLLLDAIPIIHSKHLDVKFEFIGLDTSNYEKKFRDTNSKSVNESVTFSGQVDDLYLNKSYATCDIFVAPSRYESFGLIYIEAMSYGKPVIGCEVGGVPEIIENNKNGIFTEIDPKDLASKIIFLIENEEIMHSMGLEARKTVYEKFTSEKLAQNSINYYQQIIADKNA